MLHPEWAKYGVTNKKENIRLGYLFEDLTNKQVERLSQIDQYLDLGQTFYMENSFLDVYTSGDGNWAVITLPVRSSTTALGTSEELEGIYGLVTENGGGRYKYAHNYSQRLTSYFETLLSYAGFTTYNDAYGNSSDGFLPATFSLSLRTHRAIGSKLRGGALLVDIRLS
jgi:hypothetical protein